MAKAFDLFLVTLLLIPALVLILRRWQGARIVLSVLFLLSLVAGLTISSITFWTGRGFSVELSQWTPFPCSFMMDRLSAFFTLLICFVAAAVSLFSSSYIDRHYVGARRDWLWTLLPVFVLSMLLVITASTGFAFLFGWELMTLFSAALIMVDGDSKERRHNVFIYLLMMHAGTAFVIAGFLAFLPHAPRLDFAQMRSSLALLPQSLRTTIFLMAFVGFGTKAGIVPLHLWLPKAHPIAPTPVSALMSAVMLKTAVYGFVRFAFDFLGGGVPSWWGYLVLIAGGLSGVLGVLYAIAEHDLKRLLAYHSVENIGIIYLALGAALVFVANHAPVWATLALLAGLLHCLNHAIFKGLLFLGAGAVSDSAHQLDLEELGGLLKRMRVTGIVFLIACCSIVGLPLFNGFISEWLLFRSFLAAAGLHNVAAVILPLTIGVLALIGGLAAACFAKVYGVAFLGRPRSEEAAQAREVSPAMQWGMILLAAACTIIGVLPGLLLKPLSATVQQFLPGAALPDEAASISALMPWIAASVAVLVTAIAIVPRVKKVAPTWACGLPGLNSRMQYTSTSFSKPLRKVFSRVYKPERTVEVLPVDQPFFPVSIAYRSVRTTSFEKSLYRPAVEAVVAAAHRLRRLQTGNMQVYLLYIFGALVILLLFMRWS